MQHNEGKLIQQYLKISSTCILGKKITHSFVLVKHCQTHNITTLTDKIKSITLYTLNIVTDMYKLLLLYQDIKQLSCFLIIKLNNIKSLDKIVNTIHVLNTAFFPPLHFKKKPKSSSLIIESYFQ